MKKIRQKVILLTTTFILIILSALSGACSNCRLKIQKDSSVDKKEECVIPSSAKARILKKLEAEDILVDVAEYRNRSDCEILGMDVMVFFSTDRVPILHHPRHAYRSYVLIKKPDAPDWSSSELYSVEGIFLLTLMNKPIDEMMLDLLPVPATPEQLKQFNDHHPPAPQPPIHTIH